jgi:hypothetical protein
VLDRPQKGAQRRKPPTGDASDWRSRFAVRIGAASRTRLANEKSIPITRDTSIAIAEVEKQLRLYAASKLGQVVLDDENRLIERREHDSSS